MVLDAALAVWDAEGYRGTTMAAIAARAGVSKPVLYECYDNKDDVLRALLDREEGLLMSATQAALPVDDAKGLRATVEAAYEAFFDAVLAHPVSWRIVVDAQRVMPAAIESRYHQARQLFVEQIAELVRRLTPSGRPALAPGGARAGVELREPRRGQRLPAAPSGTRPQRVDAGEPGHVRHPGRPRPLGLTATRVCAR